MIAAGVFLPRYIPDTIQKETTRGQSIKISLTWLKWTVRGICVLIAFLCVASTSCVIVGSEEVGHLKRVYMGSEMPQGRIIALPWEKGPQARVLTPGFHFIPLVRIFQEVEMLKIVNIEQGKYGFLVARDGKPMPQGQFMADEFESPDKMIDALYFMGYTEEDKDFKGPRGFKGPQLTVLPPGQYRINRYLFEIFQGSSTAIPAGSVGVVKSNVGQTYTGPPILPEGVKTTDLSVPIVPKGHRGVWKDVLDPGEYYINEKAYHVTPIDTRVQTWDYSGGYKRRWIDLKITDEGKIEQSIRDESIPIPKDAADSAVVLRIEGWDIFLDSRLQVQVDPENAPFVVAAVGGIHEIENKIISPLYRSMLRNVASQDIMITEAVVDKEGKPVMTYDNKPKMETKVRPRKVLDLLYHREELEKEVFNKLYPEGRKTGLSLQGVRFGDPAVPPELLVPAKRKQLAQQLEDTYAQEKQAQTARVQTEKERAKADQQASLMKSEIGKEIADNVAVARQKAGKGEEDYLKAVARGQEAQANVLGKDKAFELAYIKEVLAAVKEHPDMIKVPNTLVLGSGSHLEGAAAILGPSNIGLGIGQGAKSQPANKQ
jgi:hypothetical protein